jgi:hypothetical protein
MTLTQPTPFDRLPMPELVDFLREMSAKSPPKPMKAGVVHQPPAFRKPKPKSLVPKSRYRPVEFPRNAQPRPDSITSQLRALLEVQGPMTRMQISALSGVKSSRVGDLMKQDKRVLIDKTVFPQRYYVASNPPAETAA